MGAAGVHGHAGTSGGGEAGPVECPECGSASSPVWAHYTGKATVDGLDGRAEFRLPMHQCPQGHVSGWRPEDDFFVDLVLAKERADFGSLMAGTVAAKQSLIGRARCGQCDKRLRLEPTGRRLQGAVRMPIDKSHLRAEFEVDLPEVACQSCTARPSPESKAIAKTAADIDGWLFELIADAMPPERASRLEPRATQ